MPTLGQAESGNRLPGGGTAHTTPDSTRFQQEILHQGTLDEPTEMAVASDGRVFIVEKNGGVKLYEPMTGETRVIAELDVFVENENGLIGVALDPSFDRTGWLYFNRSVGDTLDIRHRVARFTYSGDGITDEKVLLEVPVTRGCCHTGGSMTFDAHGNLFISFGDNTNPFATRFAPIDGRPGRELWDARRTSANTQDLRGKILRITPQPDGTYMIPSGNLFSDPQEGRPEIYTMGHRNPYRISVDRRTGFLYWGDVGPDAPADSVLGPKGYDELNQARKAGNFGWPLFIGKNQPYREHNFAGADGELFDPERPINNSPNNSGAKVLPPADPAYIWYPYDRSEEFPLVGRGGRTAMAGPVYHYEDFPNSEIRLPRYYDGKFVHYDWIRGWVMAVAMDERGDFLRMEPFLQSFEFDHPMDMELGPEGALYVLEYGKHWNAKNPTARLSRIVYHAGNRPPVAKLTANRTVGAAPMTVEFSALGSFDHDEGDALRYTWSFDNGRTAGGLAVTHTFSDPGTYVARLLVRDEHGARAEASREIQVGNAPPEVRITLQGNRSFFWEDAAVNYQVEVRDAEDGALGEGIDPQRVRITLDYLPEGLASTPAEPGHQAERTPLGLAYMQQSDCMACHDVDRASVGPSFRRVAERYAGQPDAVRYLVDKIIQGGGGVWGEPSMSAHPDLGRGVGEEMVRYIRSLASSGDVLPASGTIQLARHKPEETGAYILAAAFVDEARNGIGPLEAKTEVILRASHVRAADITDLRDIESVDGRAADGAERRIATVQADGAYFHLPGIDLTGVGQLRMEIQSLGHAFTVELRHGAPEGALLARGVVQPPSADSWFEVVVPVRATGVQDLFVVLRSGAAALGRPNPLVRIDGIHFERAAAPAQDAAAASIAWNGSMWVAGGSGTVRLATTLQTTRALPAYDRP